MEEIPSLMLILAFTFLIILYLSTSMYMVLLVSTLTNICMTHQGIRVKAVFSGPPTNGNQRVAIGVVLGKQYIYSP